MEVTNKYVRKTFIRHLCLAVVATLFLTASAVLTLFSIDNYKDVVKNETSLEEILAGEGEKKGRIAHLDVTSLPCELQCEIENSRGLKYYLVFKDDTFYFVSMFDADFERVKKQLDEEGSARFRGHIGDITDTAIKAGALAFIRQNNLADSAGMEEEMEIIENSTVLHAAEISEFALYLNVSVSYLIFMLLCLLVSLIFFIESKIIKYYRIKLTAGLHAYDVNAELEAQSASWMRLTKVYLTENYIVPMRKGVFPIRYSNIIWMYTEKCKNDISGIKEGELLYAMCRDGLLYRISGVNIRSFQFRKRAKLDRETGLILHAVVEQNKGVIVGYTKEIDAVMHGRRIW